MNRIKGARGLHTNLLEIDFIVFSDRGAVRAIYQLVLVTEKY